MAGMVRRGLSWLGLGDEEDYDDFEEYNDYDPLGEEPAPRVDLTRESRRPMRAVSDEGLDEPAPRVESDNDGWDEDAGGVRMIPAENVPRQRAYPSNAGTAEQIRPRSSVVRPLPNPVSKPRVVTPASFNDAQEVGDLFKSGQPVIMNVEGLDRDLRRRLLDFASGVSYGLGGKVERVAPQVYLLTPEEVELSAEAREEAVGHYER